MHDLLAALLLGIIEGVTEFLPISSTGHLLIAEHWLGARSDLFNVAIQAGAILAVVAIYWQRLWSLLLGFAQKHNRDYVLKLVLAFGVTGALGLVVKKLGFQLPESLAPVAWALLIGGFVILAVEAIDARRSDLPDADPNAIGWGTALLVGLAQVLAGVFPGTSRSAAAIFAALLFGRSSRVAATEFAFLVGIPTMFAATGYELLHTLKDGGAAGEDWSALAVAFVVSALTAFAAVKWLLRYIQTHRFTLFACYRIALGAALLAWVHAGLGATSATAAATASAAPMRSDAGASAPGRPAADYLAFNDLPASAVAVQAGGIAAMSGTDSKAQLLALYHKRHRCASAAALQHGMDDPRTQDQLANLQLEDLPPEERAERLAMIEAAFRLVDESLPGCAGMAQSILDGSMYPLALRAADAGDADAAMCYASGSYAVPAEQLRNPAWRAEFARNASRLFERGIEQGDWRFVVLAQIAIPPRRSGWQLHLPATPLDATHQQLFNLIAPHGDPLRAYRYARLYALGASSAAEASARSARADAIGRGLDAATRGQGDAWAHATYARAFRSQPTTSNAVRTCR